MRDTPWRVQVPDDVKTNTAEECFNAHGLIPSLISEIKEKYGMEVKPKP